jgi:hypothetical protein
VGVALDDDAGAMRRRLPSSSNLSITTVEV